MRIPDEDATEELFDHQRTREYARFLAGALKRRARLAAGVVIWFVGLAVLALATLPRTYHVEARLLAQRNPALAVRGDGQDTALPMRGAVEAVRRRDNLLALIEATDLVHQYAAHRAPAQRLADAVRGLFHQEDDADRLDAMVERLEKNLSAWTSEGTVTIALDWPDARMAALLVDIAQQNFLEARYAEEITALAESIAIHKTHAQSLRTAVDDALKGLQQARDATGRTDRGTAKPAAPAAAAPHHASESHAGAEQVLASLNGKARALEELEEARRRRLTEAQSRLAEQRATFTDNHPAVVDLKQSVRALEAPSPQVRALREEVSGLRTEYERLSGHRSEAGPVAAAPAQLPGDVFRLEQELREDKDPGIVHARAALREAMDRYAAINEKVQSAEIDLETTQAAFKYRYSVLSPPRVPRQAVKPKAALVLAGGLFAGVFAAMLLAVIADIAAGRIVERWQVERLLDRPILGDVEVGRLPRWSPGAR